MATQLDRNTAEQATLDRLLDSTAGVPAPLTLAAVRDRAVLDPREAAEVMGCSLPTMYRWIREGVVPSRRLGGRKVCVPVPALRRALGDLDD